MKVPAFPQRRILVVDDEPLVCDAVKLMLDFDGHVVETAANGKEALARLEKNQFDLVITDFEMPMMKGDELAAAIKARTPNQPVVMITAYAEMLQSSGNPLTGVDCVISKPFLLENLREAIAKVTPQGAGRELAQGTKDASSGAG
jgi:CheY-like chemotaxis protein